MKPTPSRSQQQGAALFISLALLLVLTLIGVTNVQTSTLEEKMAGNLRDLTLARSAAEAALRESERWLSQRTSEPVPQASCASNCDNVVWQLNALNSGNLTASSVWTSGSVRAYAGGSLQAVTTPPKSIVEYHSFLKDSLTQGKQGDDSGRVIYQVTSRGTGGTDSAQTILQSTYSRRY